jgi:hypothetical protein
MDARLDPQTAQPDPLTPDRITGFSFCMVTPMELTLPPIVRGVGVHSGSAQLCILAALNVPGADVLCSATQLRLGEMLAEVLAILQVSEIDHRVDARGISAKVELGNGSRIIFREPRRDGTGAQGLHPILVWLDTDNRYAEIEATESVRRHPPVVITTV